jgi:hypothetical protein
MKKALAFSSSKSEENERHSPPFFSQKGVGGRRLKLEKLCTYKTTFRDYCLFRTYFFAKKGESVIA